MDLRERKTERAIKSAFLELRAEKPLERITVKELSQRAEISKATFYLHYHDIYDLSEQMQNAVIQDVLASIEHPEYMVEDLPEFTRELFYAFSDQQDLIDVLFSGSQASVLPARIEAELKSFVHGFSSDVERDWRDDVRLTYQIMGGYYAYVEYYCDHDLEEVVEIVGKAAVAASRS